MKPDLLDYLGQAPAPVAVVDVPFGADVGEEDWIDALLERQLEHQLERQLERACEADDDDEDEPEPTEAEMPWWFGEYDSDPQHENEDEEDPLDEEIDDGSEHASDDGGDF